MRRVFEADLVAELVQGQNPLSISLSHLGHQGRSAEGVLVWKKTHELPEFFSFRSGCFLPSSLYLRILGRIG